MEAGGSQAVKGVEPAVMQERADYPDRPGRAGAVATEGYSPQVAQPVVRGVVASLTGSFGFATGDFNLYACFPAREAGDVRALMGEKIGPDVLSLAEQVVAGEDSQDVSA